MDVEETLSSPGEAQALQARQPEDHVGAEPKADRGTELPICVALAAFDNAAARCGLPSISERFR